VLGQAVHLTLATLYKLPQPMRSAEMAHTVLRRAWARQDRSDVFLNAEEEASWGRRALRMLDDFCGGWDLRIRPLAVEEWVRARLPEAGVELFGKADRIDQARSRPGVEVIDYKTGQPRPEDDDLARQLPARLYALAAFRSFGQPVHRVRYIWLAERWEVTWQPEVEDLAEAQSQFGAMAAFIGDDREWVPAPGPGCRVCPYVSICPGQEVGEP
jgi:hypothetical protein